jgi:hypothetical protein
VQFVKDFLRSGVARPSLTAMTPFVAH